MFFSQKKNYLYVMFYMKNIMLKKWGKKQLKHCVLMKCFPKYSFKTFKITYHMYYVHINITLGLWNFHYVFNIIQ